MIDLFDPGYFGVKQRKLLAIEAEVAPSLSVSETRAT